jgi:hypothetical protein
MFNDGANSNTHTKQGQPKPGLPLPHPHRGCRLRPSSWPSTASFNTHRTSLLQTHPGPTSRLQFHLDMFCVAPAFLTTDHRVLEHSP